MAGFLSNVKNKLNNMFSSDSEEDALSSEGDKEYLELDTTMSVDKGKVTVRPFTMSDFADIKMILDVLREGQTIALVNIKPLKEKDLIELKRAINKLKKTSDAIGGDIAGFGDDYVVVTPAFARVFRQRQSKPAVSQEAEELKVEEAM